MTEALCQRNFAILWVAGPASIAGDLIGGQNGFLCAREKLLLSLALPPQEISDSLARPRRKGNDIDEISKFLEMSHSVANFGANSAD
jgi:hypothetical protein